MLSVLLRKNLTRVSHHYRTHISVRQFFHDGAKLHILIVYVILYQICSFLFPGLSTGAAASLSPPPPPPPPPLIVAYLHFRELFSPKSHVLAPDIHFIGYLPVAGTSVLLVTSPRSLFVSVLRWKVSHPDIISGLFFMVIGAPSSTGLPCLR